MCADMCSIGDSYCDDTVVEEDEAFAFSKSFKAFGSEESFVVSLAEKLSVMGRFQDSNSAYRSLIQRSPRDVRAPEFQYAIVENMRNARNDARDVDREVKQLKKAYGSGSSWALANARNASAVRKARELINESEAVSKTNASR